MNGQLSSMKRRQRHYKRRRSAASSQALPLKQGEYEKLQAQKEALYADYGKLKKQAKEYDVIKRNIDSILRQDREPERGKETERG